MASEWVETFKGAVLASEYDAEAHMNSQMYVSRFDQATWFLLHAIGITPLTMKQQKLRVAIFRQNYQFLAELRGGELVVIRSGFVAVGEKYLRFVHRMFNHETQAMLAISDCTAVQASLETGKSIALPAPLKQNARQHLVTVDTAEGAGVTAPPP